MLTRVEGEFVGVFNLWVKDELATTRSSQMAMGDGKSICDLSFGDVAVVGVFLQAL
jgi:hypothetical protein